MREWQTAATNTFIPCVLYTLYTYVCTRTVPPHTLRGRNHTSIASLREYLFARLERRNVGGRQKKKNPGGEQETSNPHAERRRPCNEYFFFFFRSSRVSTPADVIHDDVVSWFARACRNFTNVEVARVAATAELYRGAVYRETTGRPVCLALFTPHASSGGESTSRTHARTHARTHTRMHVRNTHARHTIHTHTRIYVYTYNVSVLSFVCGK